MRTFRCRKDKKGKIEVSESTHPVLGFFSRIKAAALAAAGPIINRVIRAKRKKNPHVYYKMGRRYFEVKRKEN